MNKSNFLIIGFLSFLFLSGYSQLYPQINKETKKIKLVSFDERPFFAYENSVSIIYLDKSLLINNLSKHIKNKKVCDLRKEKYSKIMRQLSENDSSFFVIDPSLSPEILLMLGSKPNTDTITGYAPLDYYSKSLKMNINEDYIPPYGFKTELDTSSLIHLEKYVRWMISELVLKGQAKVYNKKSKNYEREVIFEVVSFDGHGGENLLFPDNNPFFRVDSYSDILVPDFECGDDYKSYEIIE